MIFSLRERKWGEGRITIMARVCAGPVISQTFFHYPATTDEYFGDIFTLYCQFFWYHKAGYHRAILVR